MKNRTKLGNIAYKIESGINEKFNLAKQKFGDFGNYVVDKLVKVDNALCSHPKIYLGALVTSSVIVGLLHYYGLKYLDDTIGINFYAKKGTGVRSSAPYIFGPGAGLVTYFVGDMLRDLLRDKADKQVSK